MSTGATITIHGQAKTGKTWLGLTAPTPLLVVDAEAGGTRFAPCEIVDWSDIGQPPPGAARARITDTGDNEIASALRWLGTDQWPFRSVVVDSLTEVQSRIRRRLAPSGNMSQQSWGQLLAEIEMLVHRLRDAVVDGTLDMAVFICGSRRHEEGQWRPAIQGAAEAIASYTVDCIGYLDIASNGGRSLIVGPASSALTGNRFGGLVPDMLTGPQMSLDWLHQQLAAPSKENNDGLATTVEEGSRTAADTA